MSVRRALLVALASVPSLALAPRAALADPACRTVEVHLQAAAPGLQVVVWIESAAGKFIDTAYVTRTTGQFGLGNRPGTPLLKTDFRWPYGRREMVAPVWAHRRDHHYPKVVMGGVCGNSPTSTCPDNTACSGDCVDSTIAYHPRVSSYEPFYCSPSGASKVDVMSCASKGTFSKGAFADPPAFSLYPPRADLNMFEGGDGADAKKFVSYSDLVAISTATPSVGKNQIIDWYPPDGLPDGDYVAWVEVSQEADFNGDHNHPNQPDTVSTWDFEGHPFLGQPSIVYRQPFRIDGTSYVGSTASYAGYGAWDGQDGTLRAPDTTITTSKPGSGAGRLALVSGHRLEVVVGGCGGEDGPHADMTSGSRDGGAEIDAGPAGDMAKPACVAPAPVEGLHVESGASTLTVSWVQPAAGPRPFKYEVRYHEGADVITDRGFPEELAPSDDPPDVAEPGTRVVTVIHGLVSSRVYAVAVAARASCGARSPVVSSVRSTGDASFAVLHGCFVATAAYGSPDDRSVETLRRFRDRHLLPTPLGRAFSALYYGTSPSVAPAIAADPRLRRAARALLAPLVALAARL